MIKRLFTHEQYDKMGSPDLNHTLYFKKNGEKRHGKVVLLSFTGNKGKIQIGIEPYGGK
jgi:hypothetical protein